MPDPKVSISGGSFTVQGYAPGWSIGNLGQCRLGDNFQITPTGSMSDPQLKLGLHLIDCVWGRRGSIWLEQSLSAGGTFSLGGTPMGSLQLNNQLLWQPMKDLRFTLTFVLNGQLDQHGATGSVSFGSQFKVTDSKATMLGLGFHF
ncbi:MAG TPA: hypothetical protein VLJ59_05495 [Mycobacteriales bacterium]|nr:hypothetical protein [Mycobacteriales bacterium]